MSLSCLEVSCSSNTAIASKKVNQILVNPQLTQICYNRRESKFCMNYLKSLQCHKWAFITLQRKLCKMIIFPMNDTLCLSGPHNAH